jgi:hypothetical protein
VTTTTGNPRGEVSRYAVCLCGGNLQFAAKQRPANARHCTFPGDATAAAVGMRAVCRYAVIDDGRLVLAVA